MDNITNLDLSVLDSLSPVEKQLAISILKEYSEKGQSQQYNDLITEDYNEIPVDIETFVDSNEYLGNAWHDSEGNSKLYPYWRKELKKIFPDNFSTVVNNAIFSGSRGRGKSEIATLIAAYLLHRILCLKNPIGYFHLKPTEKIVFAFMNIKLALAEEIGVSKFQNTLQSSPWFLRHGTIEGRTRKIWIPQKYNGQEAIDIKIGSQADDLIGLPVYFCLAEDTPILTDNGVFKIGELENKNIRVPCLADDLQTLILSDECTVKETVKSDIEYEIELEDGTVIKCTPNHKFRLTNGEYKEAKDLTLADDILSFNPYGYIYKTTNIINNKIYIGQHKGDIFDQNYLGSGDMIKKSINKYGRDNFICEVLEFCKDKNTLDLKEKYYIKKYSSQDINVGYNIADGGQGGDLGLQSRINISKKLKGKPKSDAHKLALSKANLGKHLTQETKNKISEGNKGKTVSAETRSKISISAKAVDRSNYPSQKGRIAVTDGKITKYIKDQADIPPGFYFGNCNTAKKHNMSRYYTSDEMRKRRHDSSIGKNNNMYGKGYLRTGGNNTNSHKFYIFNNLRFECRKELVEYLKNNDFPNISISAIRKIENKTYSKRIENKFAYIINNLIWGYKDENKINNN